MNKKIEVLIDKYELIYLKEEFINIVFFCIKVVLKQQGIVVIGSLKMGGVFDLLVLFEYLKYKGNLL